MQAYGSRGSVGNGGSGSALSPILNMDHSNSAGSILAGNCATLQRNGQANSYKNNMNSIQQRGAPQVSNAKPASDTEAWRDAGYPRRHGGGLHLQRCPALTAVQMHQQ